MSKSTTGSRLALSAAVIVTVAIVLFWRFEPRAGRLWLNTALVVAGAGLVGMPLGVFAAVAIFKTDVPGRQLAAWLFGGMLFVPLFAVTGAWDAGFGIQGWLTMARDPHLAHEPWLAGWRAAMWVHGVAAVPWIALSVGAGLRMVEAELEEDAATCATPARVVWHVSLRRAAPSIVLAGLWLAIVVAVEISVTDFFQVRTFAEEVYTQAALGSIGLIDPLGGGQDAGPLPAAGLWIGLLLSTGLAVLTIAAAGRLFTQFTEAPHRPPWLWRVTASRWAMSLGLWSVVFVVVGVPLANLLYKVGGRVTTTDTGRVRTWSVAKVVERLAAAPGEFRGELWLSARIGAAAATAAVAIALPLAWSMHRARPGDWRTLSGLALCLTLPGPVLGIATIRLLNRPADSLGAPLAMLYDSNFAPWAVQTLRALPMVFLIVWPALRSIPPAVLDAAATEGVGRWRQLLRVAVPQRWPAVAAAWLVGLAVAVGELAATVLVIPPQPSTAIAVRVFQLLHYGVDDRVAAICLVIVFGIASLTGIAAALARRTAWADRSDGMTDDE